MAKRMYPSWVCAECGEKYGRASCLIATWHEGRCGVCGAVRMVTEPRDFGHLRDGWQDEPVRPPA